MLPRVFLGIEYCLISSCHKIEHSFLDTPPPQKKKPRGFGEKPVQYRTGLLRTSSMAWTETEEKGPESRQRGQRSLCENEHSLTIQIHRI